MQEEALYFVRVYKLICGGGNRIITLARKQHQGKHVAHIGLVCAHQSQHHGVLEAAGRIAAVEKHSHHQRIHIISLTVAIGHKEEGKHIPERIVARSAIEHIIKEANDFSNKIKTKRSLSKEDGLLFTSIGVNSNYRTIGNAFNKQGIRL